MKNLDQLAINAIRVLSIEAVEKANSGHPGLPLGAAPMAYTLFAKYLKHNPANPDFFDRDRFVLSAGHGSSLLYSLFHLFGYGLTIEDLKNFRQLGSLTPGHPEYGHTKGVETTTGPLGQGFANAVGMAMAESYLAAKYNRDGFPVVDHYTYVLSGDGCMMEGISNEAASLAGTWELGKLIVFYDSNKISIEGDTDITFKEDVAARFEALGWHTQTVQDGNDIEAIGKAIEQAKAQTKKPSLIIVKTTIGYGCPIAGSEATHGAPLGMSNVECTKRNLDYNYAPFEVPREVYDYVGGISEKLKEHEAKWNKLMEAYAQKYPELYAQFMADIKNEIPDLKKIIGGLNLTQEKPDATRNISSKILQKLSEVLPNLVGGSADLGPSTKTIMKDKGSYGATNRSGRNMHFGVREHAMAAICNGIYLHGGFNVYCSTFFVFCDYMKSSMRMSAIMNIPVVYVLTHDSIGVGEDGATHQPVEQLIALRSTPNMKVFRPCNAQETAAAWISALSGRQPTSIVLTRQNIPPINSSIEDALCGGYVLDDCEGTPDVILISTGSEVCLAVDAKKMLAEKGVRARVVSMPCMELFDAQSADYKEKVLPSSVRARVAVEAASCYSWHKYVGLDGKVVCMDEFGKSAPAEKLFALYGFTAENIAKTALELVK